MANQQTAAEALAGAKEQRRVRAELLSNMAAGTISLEQALESAKTDSLVSKIKLLPVLESLPNMGKVTSRRLLASLNIPEAMRLADVISLSQLPELLDQVKP